MLFASKDCVVEVSSDDEGFKGSYYRAILEDNPTESGHGKLKVRYLTLFNEDGSAPLTEIVDQSFIRPDPPEDLINGVVFERRLVVDAYFKNGWWTGVIGEKMKDEKYWVYFNSPGKMKNQFKKQQLRVHLDWTGLKWVRPDRKELIKSDFSSGTMVELRVGFVWVPAVMVKELENEKRFIVYVKCFNDSFFSFGGITKVITVDSRRVRPMQPPFSVGKYDLLDHVDFFYSEWRQGVVRGILFEGRYMVSFGKTKVASQFNHSELRPSMEWEDGVWHRIPKPKRQKEAPLDSKSNKSVAETRNVQMKEPLGNEMADAVVNEKGSGSHVIMGIAATENKPQGKISPEPMRKQNGLGNESTREMMPEEHNYKCYTRKRKRRELEHIADPNETVLSSDRTPDAKVLPFTKKSPFWKAYESMEVFKRVPQSPHFNPLFETREDFREGFALGMIVTYSGLLEKLKDLETDVPISQLDSLKDSFSELEKHGFDVTMPLSRIDKLLERKDRQLSILEELKGFDKERTNGSSKSWKAKQEIDETERKVLEVKHKILELQRQEAALKEQKEAAEEQKDAIYEKICHVESCTRDLDVKLKDVEFELETIISAPW